MDHVAPIPERDLSPAPSSTYDMRVVAESLLLDQETKQHDATSNHDIIVDMSSAGSQASDGAVHSIIESSSQLPRSPNSPMRAEATSSEATQRRVQFQLPEETRRRSIPSPTPEEIERSLLVEQITNDMRKQMAELLVKLQELTDCMQDRRREVAIRRTELYHHEAIVETKAGYVRETINKISRLLLIRSVELDREKLDKLNEQLEQDFAAFERLSQMTASLRQEVNEGRVDMHNLEDKVYDLIPKLSQLLLEPTGEHEDQKLDAEDVQEDETESEMDIPPLILLYHSKVGDFRVMVERLIELEHEHQEDLADRDRLRDQDIPMELLNIDDDNLAYAIRHQECESAISEAEAIMDAARKHCIDVGLRPDDYERFLFQDEDHGTDYVPMTPDELQTLQAYGLAPIDPTRTEVISAGEGESGSDSSDEASPASSQARQPEDVMAKPGFKQDVVTGPGIQEWIEQIDQPDNEHSGTDHLADLDPNSLKMPNEVLSDTASEVPSPPKQATVQERADIIAKAAVAQILASLGS